MAVIKRDPQLGRLLRVDELDELGKNSVDKLKEAIESGHKKEALDLAEYLLCEGADLHDLFTDWIYADLDWIVKNCGEEKIPEVLRYVKQIQDKKVARLAKNKKPETTEKSEDSSLKKVQLMAEVQRAHRSGPGERGDIKIWEEPDRYVLSFDACGGGGRMARGPMDNSGSRMEAPYNLGKTTKPYPWSWGKKDVPYYCTHCCVWREQMQIEKKGYPARVTECPAGDFSKPCLWYIYKKPELIPAGYFERVGYKKDPSKFKK
jgi:hypothetical protein